MKTGLLIMAAGMGSRFGGLKQAAPVGPNGEMIIDYSVSDAIGAGFDKIVIVIRKDSSRGKQLLPSLKAFDHAAAVCRSDSFK